MHENVNGNKEKKGKYNGSNKWWKSRSGNLLGPRVPEDK